MHQKQTNKKVTAEWRQSREDVCVSENIKYEGQKCDKWSLNFIVRDLLAGPKNS